MTNLPSSTVPSVHDNRVYAYGFACEEQILTLHTKAENPTTDEFVDVIFSGVVAHHFDTVLQGNILLGIDAVAPERILRAWSALFAAQKDFGWPAVPYRDLDDLAAVLRGSAVRGYEVSSSYGLSGWVLAKEMDLRARASRVALSTL